MWTHYWTLIASVQGFQARSSSLMSGVQFPSMRNGQQVNCSQVAGGPSPLSGPQTYAHWHACSRSPAVTVAGSDLFRTRTLRPPLRGGLPAARGFGPEPTQQLGRGPAGGSRLKIRPGPGLESSGAPSQPPGPDETKKRSASSEGPRSASIQQNGTNQRPPVRRKDEVSGGGPFCERGPPRSRARLISSRGLYKTL
jgi:hypothetical protein